MFSGTLQLILVLCLTGGAIAYLADWLGRTMGRKRLSLLKMRPKHTAALVTTLAGVLIPVVTMGILSLVSTDVRDMLLRTAEIKAQLTTYEGQLKTAEQDLAKRTADVADLESERKVLRTEQDKLLKGRTQLVKEKGRVEAQLKITKGDLNRTITESRKLASQARTLRADAIRLRGEVVARQSELRDITAQSKRQSATLLTQNNQLEEISQRNLQLEQDNLKLETRRNDLERRAKELESEVESLNKVSAETSRQFNEQIEQARAELRLIDNERDRIRGELDDLRRLQEVLFASLGKARTERLTFNANDEVARYVVPPQTSYNQAQGALNAVFGLARREAERRGARPEGNLPSVTLIPQKISASQELSVRDQEDLILRRITGMGDPMVMIARTVVNTFVGEVVPVRIEVEKNTIVFRQDEVIAEARIDGSQSEDAILGQIETFLVEVVSKKALDEKMIPVVGSDSPLGEISRDDILRIVPQIKSFGRTVRLQARAAVETRRADRLQIEFRLR